MEYDSKLETASGQWKQRDMVGSSGRGHRLERKLKLLLAPEAEQRRQISGLTQGPLGVLAPQEILPWCVQFCPDLV